MDAHEPSGAAMASATSRSPSPAIQAPIAASPGPRAAHLIRLYDDALSYTLKTCNYDNFASCFPTTAAYVPEALQGLHQDFVKRLEEHAKAEFDNILRERNVVTALNDLDRLVEDARRRKTKDEEQTNGGRITAPAPAHTLPAKSLYLAHVGPICDERQRVLRQRLEQLHASNADLLQTLEKQRAEIDRTIGGVETIIADINTSLEVVPPEKMQGLTKDTLSLDQQMRDVDG